MTTTEREPRAPYDVNVATLPDKDTENARNMGSEKETTNRMQLVAVVDGEIRVPLDARFYMGRSSRSSVVYCSVWMRSKDGKRHLAGRGSASGYGYHKESAALDDAMASAGVAFTRRFDGCGTEAMRVAIEACAIALGYGDCIRGIVE